VHGLAPRAVARNPDEVDEEEDGGEDARAPREREEDSEDAAGVVGPAPAEVGPVLVRDAGAGEEGDGEEEEPNERVHESVEERGVVPVVDRAQAGWESAGAAEKREGGVHVGDPEDSDDGDDEELGDDRVCGEMCERKTTGVCWVRTEEGVPLVERVAQREVRRVVDARGAQAE
jgi:hypothetical protein